MADMTFNGYRIDLKGGGSYAASLTGISNYSSLGEGEYRVVSDAKNAAALLRPPRNMAGTRQLVCKPLQQTLTTTHLYVMRPANLLYTPLVHEYYLYDFHNKSVLGIQAEQGFFHCLENSSLFAPYVEYSLEIRYAAPWMQTARKELGQKEVTGVKANPQILEYFKSSKFWGKDDTGEANAWCGSFTAWVMQQHGYTLPANAFRAKSWENFGKSISSPVYGAIGIKSRTGGGHVAFVVGQSGDGKYLYMLGGNQSDEVNISRYAKNVWNKFVVPADYDSTHDSLPIYNKSASDAGRED